MSLTPTSECDFLDQDPPLRGQNYVCLSFVSPEDVLKKKEVFVFEKFMASFSSSMGEFFDRLTEKYPDDSDALRSIRERYSFVFKPENLQNEYNYFQDSNSAALEDDFYKQNDFQTSIRGIKIRGTFDTLREAEIRAQVLKKLDDKFHVYVAQVGCWCPWSPNPDEIQNQEYAESHLNTLMKHYKQNQDKRDVFYEERKRDLQFTKVKEGVQEEDEWTRRQREEASTSASTSNEVEVVSQSTVPEATETTEATTTDAVVAPETTEATGEPASAPSTHVEEESQTQ
jgi:hypothetical protein